MGNPGHYIQAGPVSLGAAGMSYRPIAETVVDTHEWWNEQPAERRDNPRQWMTPEQETEALARLE